MLRTVTTALRRYRDNPFGALKGSSRIRNDDPIGASPTAATAQFAFARTASPHP